MKFSVSLLVKPSPNWYENESPKDSQYLDLPLTEDNSNEGKRKEGRRKERMGVGMLSCSHCDESE
jgi:hypothetical protein